VKLTSRALNRATLARQMLLRRERVAPLDAIARLAGMQAQLAKPPFIGLWTRLERFDAAELRALAAKRKVVRATLMRGTIHLVSAEDFFAWRMPLQDMLATGGERGGEQDIAKLTPVARRFFDAEPCTFDTLRKHLAERFPDGDERQMAYAVRMNLPLVLVPDDSPWGWSGNAPFAVAETYLGKKIPKSTDARDLALRYLAAFGPATAADFQTWSGLRTAKAVFEELRPQTITFEGEKKKSELFDLPDAPRPDEDTPAPVRFLPEYDNLLLAHADRSRLISDEHRKRIATNNLRLPGTFLVDGAVAGMWTAPKKKGQKLELDPFVKLDRATKKALDEEASALAAFL
jgi:Winged helix DNA-binding domain